MIHILIIIVVVDVMDLDMVNFVRNFRGLIKVKLLRFKEIFMVGNFVRGKLTRFRGVRRIREGKGS